MIIDGSPVVLPSPYASRRRGISIVYQELKLCPNLTVVENLFLGREHEGGGPVNWRRMAGEAAKVLESIGANVPPRELVSRLSIAEQQQVEIAKAISMNAWLIIMDVLIEQGLVEGHIERKPAFLGEEPGTGRGT